MKQKQEKDLISEKDLEDDFFGYLNGGTHTRIYRQLKIGNYGRADIVTIEKCYDYFNLDKRVTINITVYELKKRSVSCKSFGQGLRYMSAIIRYLNLLGLFGNKMFLFGFKVVSVGRSFDNYGAKYFLGYDYTLPTLLDFPAIKFGAIKYKYSNGEFEYYDVDISDVQLVDHGLNEKRVNRIIKKIRNGQK